MADPQQLTPAAHTRLCDELEDLSTRGRVEIARAIERARELGDLSENGDYHAAKDEQGRIEARIRQLQSILEDATVIDSVGDGSVGVGCIVELRYEGDDDTERYLVGSIEEKASEVPVLSPASPLGQALLKTLPGDKVTYEAPGGALVTVEVVSVEG